MDHIKRSFAVSLHVEHPLCDPDNISQALGLSASRQHRVGQPRTTAAGSPLKGAYPRTYWAHDFDTGGRSDLTECLSAILDALEPHTPYLSNVVHEGGSIELFCGVFADGNWDECFDHVLLRSHSFGDFTWNLKTLRRVWPLPQAPCKVESMIPAPSSVAFGYKITIAAELRSWFDGDE